MQILGTYSGMRKDVVGWKSISVKLKMGKERRKADLDLKFIQYKPSWGGVVVCGKLKVSRTRHSSKI